MDTIPFHIQISGPRSTLSKLIPNMAELSGATGSGSDGGGASSSPSAIFDTLPIHISLLRQVVLEIDGRKAARQISLGESKLVAIPPPPPSPPTSGSKRGGHQEKLNWEGEVRCELEEGVCPSFNAGMVSVIVSNFIELFLSNSVRAPTCG